MDTAINPFDFDHGTEPGILKQEVTYKGKRYWLVEAFGDTVARFHNASLKGANITTNQKGGPQVMSFGNPADAQFVLLAGCLYEADPNDGSLRLDMLGNVDTRFRVPEATIRQWPNRVLDPLFEKAKRMSGVDKEETEDSIKKQIENLQGRLAKIQQAKEPTETDALAKNLP